IILDYKTDKFKEYDSLILFYDVDIQNPFKYDSIHKSIKLKHYNVERSKDYLSLYGKNRGDSEYDEVFLCSLNGEDSLRSFMLKIYAVLIDTLFKNTYSVDENDWIENRWAYSEEWGYLSIRGRAKIR
ncbi:MAG: hypothetical protein ACTTJH_08230, partial [Bacteroidales bacterium]